MTHQPTFIQRCIRAFVIGLPGVIALPWLIDAPPVIPAAALTLGPAIMLVAAAFAGAWASIHVGVRSRLILRDRVTSDAIVLGLVIGTFAGLAVALIDQATLPLWRGEATHPPSVVESMSLRQFALGVLYGGLTEEIVFRWGIGSIVAALSLLLMQRRLAITASIVVVAAMFSVAHLPAALAGTEFWHTGALVRTLGWNALLGLLFGILFFRNGLEAAILAHVGFHCGTAIAGVF